MAATRIQNPLPGEDLLAIEPELLQQVDAGWLQRLSLFTGRNLSDTALTNEQLYRRSGANPGMTATRERRFAWPF